MRHPSIRLKKFKMWSEAVNEELGLSMQEEINGVKCRVEKIKSASSMMSKNMLDAVQRIVKHNNEIEKHHTAIGDISNKFNRLLHMIKNSFKQYNDEKNKEQLRLSVLETEASDRRKEIDDLKKQMMELQKAFEAK